MKIYSLIALAFLLVFQGCKKSDGVNDSSEKGFLTFKMNGKNYDYSAKVNANDKPSEKEVHFVVIGGHENENPLSPGFGIDLLVPDAGATTTTYTTANAELSGQYYVQNIKNEQIESTTTYFSNGSDGTNFVLKITRLNEKGVSGEFSGILKLSGGEEILNVTDGKFSASYNGVN